MLHRMHTLFHPPKLFHPHKLKADVIALLVCLVVGAPIAWADNAGTADQGKMRVYAYTLKHQPAHEALALIRPLLTSRGTVEVQPGGNTLVIRESKSALSRLTRVLAEFDHTPEELRFDIRIVRAGPKRNVVSPPKHEDAGPLPEELAARLRELLRYDDYRVLAEAGVTSQEGEDVTYDLGQTYSVSFRSGTVMAGQRVKLEGFRIVKHGNATNKARQLKPKELFHATVNLWLGRPFNLVLAQDESSQEALMVAISCQRTDDASDDAPGAPKN